MNLTPGFILGSYKVEALIGHGSMADVYRARRMGDDRIVAIKVIHPYLLKESGTIERFRREAKILSEVEHPYIVKLYEFANSEDVAYIVMEHLGGGTLEARITERRDTDTEFPLGVVVRWMEAIGSAVDCAHAYGLIHRDLKPSNILFRDNSEPVLTDFGLAHLVDHSRLSSSASITGTPTYMSPEQARGALGDERSDVYSLGVILYEILTGQTPFQGTMVSVIMKHISEPPPSPRLLGCYLPVGVEAVLMRALAKNPLERFQSATALARALRSSVDRTALASDETAPAPSEPSASGSANGREATVAAATAPPDVSVVGEAAAAAGAAVAARKPAVTPTPPAGKPGPRASTRGSATAYSASEPIFTGAGPAARPAPWSIVAAIAMAAAFLGFIYWAAVLYTNPDAEVPRASARFSVNSQVRVNVPNQSSVSVLRGCPAGFWIGVVGVATDGDTGQVLERQTCGGLWWYRVRLSGRSSADWDGTGWIDGQYLQTR